MSIDPFKVMLEVMLRLPRQGAGSPCATLEALAAVPDLPDKPVIFDFGCGAGGQTMDLLGATNAQILAVDIMVPMLESLSEKAEAAGISPDRLQTKCADLADLDLHGQKADLIWSEGAIYNFGLEKGLDIYAKHLKPGGTMAVSEICWLTGNPPRIAKHFWDEAYPAMLTVEETMAKIKSLGFDVLETVEVPQNDWMTYYYSPMKQAIQDVEDVYGNDLGEGRQVLNALQHEIDVFEKSQGSYSYVFFVVRR